MIEIEKRFNDEFSHWNIRLPEHDVVNRRRGKIVEQGWAIWYLFGAEERGEYLDYYAAHRMTNDRHVRIRANGDRESLPSVQTMRMVSRDPEEDARLAAEHLEKNRQAARILEEKGFGIAGDEPGGVQINRYLGLRQE